MTSKLDRQLLLDDIEEAQQDLALQLSLAQGNAGNAVGINKAAQRLADLEKQLDPINDALEELGIERVEFDPNAITNPNAGGAGAGMLH